MGRRRAFAAVTVLAAHLAPVAAEAGHHNFAVFVGGSGTDNKSSTSGGASVWNGGLSQRTDSIGNGVGWHVNGEATLKAPEAQKYRIGFVADISGHFVGKNDKQDATQMTIMVGPQVSLRPLAQDRLNFFAHVLVFGAIHRSDSTERASVTTQAMAFGAGVDVTPARKGHLGLRLQVDRLVAATGVENTTRYSLGFVYLFH